MRILQVGLETEFQYWGLGLDREHVSSEFDADYTSIKYIQVTSDWNFLLSRC